jgi:hypothetical protein
MVLAAALALESAAALANGRVTLAWDANSEPDLAGYKVYYGINSRVYPFTVSAGNVTNLTISNLQEGVTYYFAATAYNSAGLESDFSIEIDHIVPRIRATTTASLSSSANPANPGQPVTFTFRVHAETAVTNAISGAAIFQIGQSLNTAVLVNGLATFATSTLPIGTHPVVAWYAGDANFLGVTNRLAPDQVINTPPVARADSIDRIPPSSAMVLVSTLLTNDSDPDGHALTLTSVSQRSAAGASVTRRSNWIYYIAPESVAGDDSFTYTASDPLGGIIAGNVNVRVVDPPPAPNITVSQEGDSYRIRFDGAPNVTYRIEFAETNDPSSWQQLTTRTADEFGIVEVVDTPPTGLPPRTYRGVAIY